MGLTPFRHQPDGQDKAMHRHTKPMSLSGLGTEAEQALEFLTTTTTITEDDEQHARLTVCDAARDAADARELLEALGLVEPHVAPPKRTRPDGSRKPAPKKRKTDASRLDLGLNGPMQ